MEKSLKDKYAGIYGGDGHAGTWLDVITSFVAPDDLKQFHKWLYKRAVRQGYATAEKYIDDEIYLEIEHLNSTRHFNVENSAYIAPKKVAERLKGAYDYWLDVDKPIDDEINKANAAAGINTDF